MILRLGVLIVAWATWPAFAADSVMLILSERTGIYLDVADTLRAELGPSVIATQHIAGESVTPDSAPPRLIVAVGAQACRVASEGKDRTPVLCTLLPRNAFERITSPPAKLRPISGIWLDQPASRQMALIGLALPDWRRVAALLGPESSGLASPLNAAAKERGLQFSGIPVNHADEIYAGLRRVVGATDVLLAVPDATVYNGSTIRNILLTSLRDRYPVVAFSPAYVQAGALLAVYSTPAQIGRQTGRAVRDFLAGRPLPASQPPHEFVVSVNRNVARALSIPLDDDAVLTERLRKLELPR